MIQKILKCDICGKSSGIELKDSDFVIGDKTSITIKNWKGEDIILSFNVSIKQPKKIEKDAILKDVMNEYSMFNHLLVDDDEDENGGDSHNIMSYQNFMQQQTAVNNAILKRISNTNTHICKSCYKGITMLLSKYGKVNKRVVI
jgi:nitrate/TMAO reductase-like tetraheme cytochrome c subunit